MFEWEKISGLSSESPRTYRAAVLGGWVLRTESWNDSGAQSESMVFISDPNYEWVLDDY